MKKKLNIIDNQLINTSNYSGAAVYAIIDKNGMNVYVGSTMNYQQRIKQHATTLKHNRHANKKLNELYQNGARLEVLPIITYSEIDKNMLVVFEKIAMLELLKDGFNMLNATPKMQIRALENDICFTLVWNFGISKKIDTALKKSFNGTSHRYYLNKYKNKS